MLLNVVVNECLLSVCETKHNKLKESPEAVPRTRVEPTNGSRRQMTDCMAVLQNLWTSD